MKPSGGRQVHGPRSEVHDSLLIYYLATLVEHDFWLVRSPVIRRTFRLAIEGYGVEAARAGAAEGRRAERHGRGLYGEETSQEAT